MQTFLSEHTFADSARALDPVRLNKQLLEGRQMLAAIRGEQAGFRNHPATKMWENNLPAFLAYLGEIKREMKQRHIAWEKNWDAIRRLAGWTDDSPYERIVKDYADPDWFRGESKDRIITTHRANLYLKKPDHYAHYAPAEIDYSYALAHHPLTVVCCANRRRVPGKTGLQPCGYFGRAM